MNNRKQPALQATADCSEAGSPGTGRLYASTPDLDSAELDWWRTFADVEEQYCWVQTPELQQFLRGDYLRDIVRSVAGSNRVAELGCGTGWLGILLARLGCGHIVGYDFSPKQIQIANMRANEAGVAGKASFVVADAAKMQDIADQFDVVFIHGFLHHLAVVEILHVIRLAYNMLHKGGKLIVFEPVLYSNGRETLGTRLARKAFSIVMRVAKLHGNRWRLRGIEAEEQAVRRLLAKRAVGVPPRGVSPKEMPFGVDELPAILQPLFNVTRRRRCMVVSHLVAQELLLLQLSYPRFGKTIFWPLVWLGRWIDRRLLAGNKPPLGAWVFEMFECLRVEAAGQQVKR